MKKAFITGITGQDGSYLVEFLLSKGYKVHGIIRRASTFNTHRKSYLKPKTRFKDLVRIIMEAYLERVSKEK